MFQRVLLTATIALAFLVIPIAAIAQDLTPESEDERTRLTKDEITRLMIKVGRMGVLEQQERMDNIGENKSNSATPRSDFLFSTAFAYLGHNEAQAYLGFAYENGRGIVEDLQEAYIWYSIALEEPIDDKATAQEIRAARDRLKVRLQSNYPGPSDEELDEMVKVQRDRITEYLAEIRNTKL